MTDGDDTICPDELELDEELLGLFELLDELSELLEKLLEETFCTSKNTEPNPLNLMVKVAAPAVSTSSSPTKVKIYGSTPMSQTKLPPEIPHTKVTLFIVTFAV